MILTVHSLMVHIGIVNKQVNLKDLTLMINSKFLEPINFCQTFSMMHLLDALPGDKNQICPPWDGDPEDFKRFYYYTECALKFILNVAEHCKKTKN